MRRLAAPTLLTLLAGPMSLALWGCPQQPQGREPSTASNNTPTKPTDPTTNNTPTKPVRQASADYSRLCASCHGAFGEGGVGPRLDQWQRGRQALVEVIDRTMPTSAPEQCVGACAEDIADLILRGFQAQSCDPSQAQLPPRHLRLLNRVEYTQTIRDLFSPYLGAATAGAMCLQTSSCEDPGQQTCRQGLCSPRACDERLFVFDPGGRALQSVHVAGSFNGWPGQQAQGGLAMTFDDTRGVWMAEAKLPEGAHAYKFVLNNQEWVPDTANPDRVDDTFGGFNSVLRVSCEAASPQAPLSAALAADWSDGLPAEQRTEGFSFDHSVETLYVTSLHLDTYLRHAKTLSALALRAQDKLAPCASAGLDQACAEQTAQRFGLRALRRPLTSPEVQRYAQLMMASPEGLGTMIRAMLSSPHFLYRFELGQAQPDGTFKLDDYELASALSYLYWGTMPDDALLQAAQRQELSSSPEALAQHARRLLADARAQQTLGRFAEQWLGIYPLRTATKNTAQFPQMDAALRQAMLEETRQLFTRVALDPEASYKTLFTADYTYVNKRLAQLYGLSGPSGDAFERVQDTTGQRDAGVLTHASVLATFAYPDQSSPVKRGLFVRGHLLCQEFPPPPANAGNIPDVQSNTTTRERFSQHSDDPACSSCHQFIDPVGFGFEHYDAIGQWRTSDAGRPVDASGGVKDIEGFGQGTNASFTQLKGLGQLLAQSEAASRCMTQQAFRFTFGFKESLSDRCTIDDLHRSFKASDYTLYDLLVALPQHRSFTHRQR